MSTKLKTWTSDWKVNSTLQLRNWLLSSKTSVSKTNYRQQCAQEWLKIVEIDLSRKQVLSTVFLNFNNLPIVHWGQAMISLLSGRIPNLEFNSYIFQAYCLCEESSSNCWLLIILKILNFIFEKKNLKKKPESVPWQNATQAMTCRRRPRQVRRVWIEVFCLEFSFLSFCPFSKQNYTQLA